MLWVKRNLGKHWTNISHIFWIHTEPWCFMNTQTDTSVSTNKIRQLFGETAIGYFIDKVLNFVKIAWKWAHLKRQKPKLWVLWTYGVWHRLKTQNFNTILYKYETQRQLTDYAYEFEQMLETASQTRRESSYDPFLLHYYKCLCSYLLYIIHHGKPFVTFSHYCDHKWRSGLTENKNEQLNLTVPISIQNLKEIVWKTPENNLTF